jgi:hypothetical protein
MRLQEYTESFEFLLGVSQTNQTYRFNLNNMKNNYTYYAYVDLFATKTNFEKVDLVTEICSQNNEYQELIKVPEEIPEDPTAIPMCYPDNFVQQSNGRFFCYTAKGCNAFWPGGELYPRDVAYPNEALVPLADYIIDEFNAYGIEISGATPNEALIASAEIFINWAENEASSPFAPVFMRYAVDNDGFTYYVRFLGLVSSEPLSVFHTILGQLDFFFWAADGQTWKDVGLTSQEFSDLCT